MSKRVDKDRVRRERIFARDMELGRRELAKDNCIPAGYDPIGKYLKEHLAIKGFAERQAKRMYARHARLPHGSPSKTTPRPQDQFLGHEHVLRMLAPETRPAGHFIKSSPVTGGLRYDDGKPRVDLLPPDALIELGKLYAIGAKKYALRNWEQGMPWSKVIGPLMRHLFKWLAGAEKDEETGLSHMTHVAWNALALMAYEMRKIGEDDRNKVWQSNTKKR